MDQKERDNLLCWDGKKRGFFEVYFLKFNDILTRTAGWLRYTLTSPLRGDPYCELWGIFFDVAEPGRNFAVKERFPIARLTREKNRFALRIGEAALSQNACSGSIHDSARGHSLSWDLQFDSAGASLHQWPYPWMYTAPFPKTKMKSPHLDARFSGTLTAGGKSYKLDRIPGQQSHMWGAQHGLRWAWGHCNTFRDRPGTVWEGLDAQIKLGPFKSPHMKYFYLKTGGREYWFNDAVKLFSNKSDWKLGSWKFEARNRDIRMRGEVTSRMEEFVGVTYTDPDGEQLWCNNSKVADLKLELFHSDGRPMGELTAEQSAAAEYVDRKTYPEVPIQI
jgi:hypothetical protein